MKLFCLFLLTIFLTISCSVPPESEKANSINPEEIKEIKVENDCPDFETLYPNEIFTLYQKLETNFNLIKAFQHLSGEIEVNFISLKPQKGFEPLQQKLIKKETYNSEEIEKFKREYETKYSWTPYKENDVLFIQIQPTKEILGETEDIDLRNDIEDLIDQEFQKTDVGDFFAADLGPGGLNMLCSSKNKTASMKAILKVLCENGLQNHTLITKRIATGKENWIYEVSYPKDYTGEFNSL